MHKSMKPSHGFTLLEIIFTLSIVITLASIIFISSSSTRTTAQANNIINDLENIRMAYSILCSEADDRDINDNDIANVRRKFSINSITKYINDTISLQKYQLKIDDDGSWFVFLKIENGQLRSKLAGHAQSSGLLGAKNDTLQPLEKYSGQDYVIVKLR